MSLLVRVVDVMVLLWLLVLPGVVVDDAQGDVDAAGGDANGDGVVGGRCVAPVPLALMLVGLLRAVATPGWGPGGWRWWRLFACPAAILGDADDGGALDVTLCRGSGGYGRGVVGDIPGLVVGGVGGRVDSAWGVGVAGVADSEGVTGDTWLLACLLVV